METESNNIVTDDIALDSPEIDGRFAAREPISNRGISTVAAIILNYRTPELTIGCLESLLPEREGGGPTLRAVVVDNASGDGSDDRIESAIRDRGWESWTRLVRSSENRGFSAGNNLGIATESADAYLLLNSDTIVRPGAVRELCSAYRNRPGIGMISPRLEWPDGTSQRSCFRELTPLTELVNAAATGPISKLFPSGVIAMPVSDIPLEPAWTSFACILIRAEVFKRIGPMDETFFMYFEDVDFCRRARLAGIGILHWPDARVVHLRGQSGSVKSDAAALRRRPGYYYAARSRYFTKHGGRVGLWLGNTCWTLGRMVSWTREVVGRKKPHVCQKEWLDNWTGGGRVAGPHHSRVPSRTDHQHE
jgi:GT2 family glycosyltransferase